MVSAVAGIGPRWLATHQAWYLDKVRSIRPDGHFGKGAVKLGEYIVNHVILLVLNLLNDSNRIIKCSQWYLLVKLKLHVRC